jgi:hypothetical protein
MTFRTRLAALLAIRSLHVSKWSQHCFETPFFHLFYIFFIGEAPGICLTPISVIRKRNQEAYVPDYCLNESVLCRPPQVNNYYSSGPSFGFSPFGFSPFGFSPFGYGGGAVVVGAPMGGLGILFDLFLITALVGVVSSVFSAFTRRREDDKDGW